MAIPVTNIPVLTGKVAERFIRQCEYNSKYLAGSEFTGTFEEKYGKMMERSKKFLEKNKK